MECKLFGGITIAGPDRAGIACETTTDHAVGLPFPRAQMRATAWNIKARCRYGRYRAGSDTGLVNAYIAWMLRKCRCEVIFNGIYKSQRATIAVPHAINRMDQYTERRCLQAFGLHGPSLERLPWGIRRKLGRGTQAACDWPDDCLRPVLERVGPAGILRQSPPLRERCPDRAPDIAKQDHASRRHAIGQ